MDLKNHPYLHLFEKENFDKAIAKQKRDHDKWVKKEKLIEKISLDMMTKYIKEKNER